MDAAKTYQIVNRQPLTLPELSEAFRRLCAESPYTMKQVLDAARIPQQYPSKWAKGQGRPLYYYEIVRLAQKLNQPVEVFLFKGSEDFVHIPRPEYESQVHIPKTQIRSWIDGQQDCMDEMQEYLS